MKCKFIVCAVLATICLFGCSDDDDTPTGSAGGTKVYELLASHCDPLTLNVQAGQKVTITATDTVLTHVGGNVVDCDFWTDADGIPDCHYVDDVGELHGLPFMALIGTYGDEYFLVGTSFDSTFADDGQLALKVNDWGPCGDDSDNVGRFMISVLIE